MQTLKYVWALVRKYSGLLIGLLLAALTFIMMRKKPTVPVVPQDADRDGVDDQQQIEEIQQEAQEHRDAAQVDVQAAQDAVQRPTVVTPSPTVREAVQRNNEVDY